MLAAAAAEPAPLPGIARSSCLKMLGVSIENNFSIAQHVKLLVTASAQTVYALHVLRSRRLDDNALQHIYGATVVARLMYVASAWRGLTKAPDRKRIDSVLDRARRHGTAHQTCRRTTSSVTLPTMNCLAELCDCLTTSSTH